MRHNFSRQKAKEEICYYLRILNRNFLSGINVLNMNCKEGDNPFIYCFEMEGGGVKVSYDNFIENRDVLSWNIVISTKMQTL